MSVYCGLRKTIGAVKDRQSYEMKGINMTYFIVRFYRERYKSSRIIKRGLTLEQAQAHCRNPSTQKEGEWFDGYDSEGK